MNFLMYLTLLGLLLFLLKPCQVEESRERAVVALANRQQKMHTSSSQSLVRKKKGGGEGCHVTYDGGGSNGSSGWRWWREKKKKKKRKPENKEKEREKRELGCKLACATPFLLLPSLSPPQGPRQDAAPYYTCGEGALLKSSESCPQRPRDCSFGSPGHPFPYSQTCSRAHWSIYAGCRRGPHSDTGSR